MLFDIPESLVEKVRKVMEETTDTPPEPDKYGSEDEKEPKRKGEPIEFNPEIRPDLYTEPYRVQKIKEN
jgi:hypothetical protein